MAQIYAKRLIGLNHCDLRLEVNEGLGSYAENGNSKSSGEERGLSFGVRVLAEKDGAIAPGYYGRTLGAADLERMERILRDGVRQAYDRASANAAHKALSRQRFGRLGATLYDSSLAPITSHVDTISAKFEQDPRQLTIGAVTKQVAEVSRAMTQLDNKVVHSGVGAFSMLTRDLFCSSGGSDIDHTYAQTEGFVFVIANGEHGPMEQYDFTGHQCGWEIMERGYKQAHIRIPNLMDFSLALARMTVETSDAPPLPTTDGEVVVVTDPHYNTLLVHEIVGHPSELDRAMKMEAGYAGRSWLFNDLNDTRVGERVGSPLVNAVSDANIEGYGNFPYDHEGTPSRRVWHIRDGIFEEFLNSRQTAAIMGVSPNGGYRANDASMVPLIRMTNTFFLSGESDADTLIKEVDHGYYVKGNRIPSISESRENFRISAMQIFEIEHGELGQLYRDGAVTADSKDFFMHVDGVGSDLLMFPIPNCGKGQPMQAKRMGNGGPTMRSVAQLVGP